MSNCNRCGEQVIFAQHANGQWMPPLQPNAQPILQDAVPDESFVVIIWDEFRGSYRTIAQGTNISYTKLHDCPVKKPPVDREAQFLEKKANSEARAKAKFSTAPSTETNRDLEYATIPLEEPAEDDEVARAIDVKEYVDNLIERYGHVMKSAKDRYFAGDLGNGEMSRYKIEGYQTYLSEWPTVVALSLPCPRCEATEGQWCKSLLPKGTPFEDRNYIIRLHSYRVDNAEETLARIV